MTDQAEPQNGRGGRLDPLQILFWVSVAIGLAAAGVAVTAGPSVGRAGAVLLILLMSAGLVLFFWMSRGAGRRHGAFPERGALENAMLSASRSEAAIVEALDEAAMVSDRNLSPLAANAPYIAIAEASGALGESDRPPMMSRLFGADPLLSAPMFRLAKSAGQGQVRREMLPPTTLAAGGKPMRYEAVVTPMGANRVLWRLREIGAGEDRTQEDRQIFIDDAPIGFVATRADGSIAYMNRALRVVLGVGEDPTQLKLRDVLKDDPSKLVRRDRRGLGMSRAKITLRAHDGDETHATALTFWPSDTKDQTARTLIFFTEEENPEEMTLRVPASVEADGVFMHAPFGAAVLDATDPAAAALLDSNPALMEMTQGRAAPGVAFADLFEASEGPTALAQRLRKAINEQVELTLATSPPISCHVQFARSGDGKGIAYLVNVSEQRELET
ncbi:MAG: hypothetical protein ABUL55_00025, partial [Pseudomonadota bacterium]